MRAWLARLAGLRLLPVAVAVMGLLAMVKAAALLDGAAAPIMAAARAMLPSAQAASSGHAAPAPAVAPAAPAPVCEAPSAPPADPGPSEAERALLQDLRARRIALEAREQALQGREALAVASEKHLSERVDQLSALQTRLEQLDQTRRERDDANWRGLVKTYEAMRPRDAAAIFNELEQPVLIQVLDRMKEAKAAPILAAMQPDRARAATAQLVQWRTRDAGPKT